jgi:hypothetical protein
LGLCRNAGGYRYPSFKLRQYLRPERLIDMGCRIRLSARLGFMLFDFGKSSPSSISLGGREVSCNIPVINSGGTRTIVSP